MAHNNEYYTFEEGYVNGHVSMNVRVFDEITKRTVQDIDDVSLDASQGILIPGTKSVISCSIKDNHVYIAIHVRLKYGVNVSLKTKEIQEKIAMAIKQMTDVEVTRVDIEVDNIEF